MFENCSDWFTDRAAISAPATVEWEHEDKKVLCFTPRWSWQKVKILL